MNALSHPLPAWDDDPPQALTEFRHALADGSERLRQLFEAGVAADEVVPARARLIDRLLSLAWQQQIGQTGDFTLVAVGGYGRGELHPGSDIDLLILSRRAVNDIAPRQREQISQFITFLWDIGLTIGHSVRSPAECASESRRDVTVITNLIEARLLVGSAALFADMQRAIAPDQLWSSREFFAAKKQEQARRYAKYHETGYNLEPNVKEGPGGLRDIQTIAWVAKRHFGVNTLFDLVVYGFLTSTEYRELVAGQRFLWQVRLALHMIAKRREDRLVFDHQLALARHFGHQETQRNAAIEQFMQRYFRTVMELSRLNEVLLQLFEEVILLDDAPDPSPVALNKRFQLRHGFLEVTDPTVFQRNPFSLLEIFLLLAQHEHIKGVRATTVRLIRDHRHLIDDRFRADPRAKSLFMELLRQPEGITRQLRRMNRYGILGAYLPEFGRIMGRMQYDLFHVYTVDTHTLFVLRNLRRFYLPRFAHEFPHCAEVMERIAKPELLYIAALYHDIAKGRDGDHSELGAHDALRFCQRHGLPPRDGELVAWLVRHHLQMSMTAQKRDIYDPQVIEEFAHLVGDQERLDHLYLLTTADIRATNPSLWNDWRESLLVKLYHATHRALLRGLDHPVDKFDRIREAKAQALAGLRRNGIAEYRVKRVWASFSDDYFLRHAADEVVWHTRAVLKKINDDRALILARPDPSRGGTEIFVYTRDKPAIFALTTAVLEQLGLTVLDARIITSPCGYTLDSYTVVESDGQMIAARSRMKEILFTLRSALNQTDYIIPEIRHYTPRSHKHFRIATRVTFTDDPLNQRTIMELATTDRPGLLSRVGRAFLECKIHLLNAKIGTVGIRAEDIFFITDHYGLPLKEPEQFIALRRALIFHLDGTGAN